MRRTFDEVEALAYITNDQRALAVLSHVEEMLAAELDSALDERIEAEEELEKVEKDVWWVEDQISRAIERIQTITGNHCA